MPVLKTISTKLKNQDLFGHQVQLNFNRNGSVHTTPLGGVFSIFLKTLYIIYFSYLLNKMFDYGEDRTYSYENTLGHNKTRNFKEMNL